MRKIPANRALGLSLILGPLMVAATAFLAPDGEQGRADALTSVPGVATPLIHVGAILHVMGLLELADQLGLSHLFTR